MAKAAYSLPLGRGDGPARRAGQIPVLRALGSSAVLEQARAKRCNRHDSESKRDSDVLLKRSRAGHSIAQTLCIGLQ